MFYNREVTEFVCETLSAKHNTDFLSAVDLYLNSWKDRERDEGKCGFCSFVFHRTNAEETKVIIEKIREFATRMPLSCTGTVFVWYYVVKKFGISIATAADINPESIFCHLILRTCTNDLNSNTPSMECIPKMLELQAVIAEQLQPEVEICEKDTLTTAGKKLRVNFQMMMENLKKGGCYGYNKDKQSRCIYSNTGCYDLAAVSHSLNTDARVLVAPSWVEKHLPEVSLEEFYDEENYMLYQPSMRRRGAAAVDIANPPAEKRAKRDDNNEPSAITSLFAVEGELKHQQRSSAPCEEKNKFFWDRYFNRADAVMTEIRVLYELHRSCYNPDIRGTRKLRLGLRSEPCLWCTVCISPAARRTLYDLISTAEEQVRVLGMKLDGVTGCLLTGDDAVGCKFYCGTANECEEEATKGAVTDHERRRKGRRGAPSTKAVASRQADVLYTLDLEGCRIQCEPIGAVFREWVEEKYPFMQNVLAVEKRREFEDTIRQHCTSDGNVFCICNMRRMFSDADCCMKTNHVCLLPFLFHGAKTVVQLLGEEKCLNILKGRINCLTARHHMSPRIA